MLKASCTINDIYLGKTNSKSKIIGIMHKAYLDTIIH
jgi:hypothetical protein